MKTNTLRALVPLALALALAACGGGGGGDASPTPTPTPSPSPSPTPVASATLALAATSGSVAAGASASVTVSVTRGGGFAGEVVLGVSGLPAGVSAAPASIAAGADSATLTFSADAGAAAATASVSVTGSAGGVAAIAPVVFALTVTPAPAQVTPVGDALFGTAASEGFAGALALSADGRVMAVGAPLSNVGGTDRGAVRLFQRSGSTWVPLGADLSGEAAGDRAGSAVALNAAGTRVAVGAPLNDGRATNTGHVRVHEWDGSAWVPLGNDIDPPTDSGAGSALRLSASGDRIVIGAPGLNTVAGGVFVYEWNGTSWTQLGASLRVGNQVGTSVAISADGQRIAHGAPGAQSSTLPGTVVVWDWNGSDWVAAGTLQGEALADGFGESIALSADGRRLVVGAPGNRDGGVAGGGARTGAFYVYEQDAGGQWVQMGADLDGLLVGNSVGPAGSQVAISDDGTLVATTMPGLSRVRVYHWNGSDWVALDTDLAGGSRATSLAIAGDGRSAVAGFTHNPPQVRTFDLAP